MKKTKKNKKKLEQIFKTFASPKEILDYEIKNLKKQIKIQKPEKGEMGLRGLKGEKGDKGEKGGNGSPDTPQEVRNKLQILKGEERLDASAIKNLPIYKRNNNEVLWGGYGQHNLLSQSHGDTTAGTVVRGDLITGQGATATWSRLALGTNATILYSNGTDVSWSAVSTVMAGYIPYTGATANADLGNYSLTANGITLKDGSWFSCDTTQLLQCRTVDFGHGAGVGEYTIIKSGAINGDVGGVIFYDQDEQQVLFALDQSLALLYTDYSINAGGYKISNKTLFNVISADPLSNGFNSNYTTISSPYTSIDGVGGMIFQDQSGQSFFVFDVYAGYLKSYFNVKAPQFVSEVATGQSPYACTSTTLNTNLNADLLDGNHASAFQPAGSYESPLTFNSPLSRTGNAISFLYNTTNNWTGSNTFTQDVVFQGNTNAQIILNTNGNNTVYTSAVAFRRMTGGGLGIDCPANVFINIDADNNTTTGQFGIRANATATNIFYVNENIGLSASAVGSQISVPVATMSGDGAYNFYNFVAAGNYAQNYNLTTTSDYIPNAIGMWFYQQFSSGFNSGKTVFEAAGMGGIHYMAGATGTITTGHAILGYVWSGSGTVATANCFTARSRIQSTGTAITTLRGYFVEDLVSDTGSPTLPTTHYGFYCSNLTKGTNNYGLYIENFTDTTNDYAIYVAGGRTYLDGIITLKGAVIRSYVAKTTTYSIGASDYTIDCTSGTFTTTLPTAVGIAGKCYVIKNSGTGVITIATTSSQTIDGASTMILGIQYESLTLISTGSNWAVI